MLYCAGADEQVLGELAFGSSASESAAQADATIPTKPKDSQSRRTIVVRPRIKG